MCASNLPSHSSLNHSTELLLLRTRHRTDVHIGYNGIYHKVMAFGLAMLSASLPYGLLDLCFAGSIDSKGSQMPTGRRSPGLSDCFFIPVVGGDSAEFVRDRHVNGSRRQRETKRLASRVAASDLKDAHNRAHGDRNNCLWIGIEVHSTCNVRCASNTCVILVRGSVGRDLPLSFSCVSHRHRRRLP